jgi:hypothetical protein
MLRHEGVNRIGFDGAPTLLGNKTHNRIEEFISTALTARDAQASSAHGARGDRSRVASAWAPSQVWRVSLDRPPVAAELGKQDEIGNGERPGVTTEQQGRFSLT